MKQKLLALMLLALLPLAVSAEIWKVDGVYYEVQRNYANNTVAKIIKSPTGYSGNLKVGGRIKKPDDVISGLNSVYAYVSCIDKDAFEGCSGLTSISISMYFDSEYQYNGKKPIPAGLFKDCPNLSQITLNNGTWGWYYSPNGSNAILTDVSIWSGGVSLQGACLVAGCKNTKIPSDVVSIGYEAFAGCGLTEITIPNHVAQIEDRAFADCTKLKTVNINGFYRYDPSSNYDPLRISQTAFDGCTSLATVVVKSGVFMSYGDTSTDYGVPSPFSVCPALTEVIFEEGVTEIGGYAFAGCEGLASIKIPNGVIRIDCGAFAGCTRITSIRIPNSVKKIVGGAFESCTGLTSVSIGGDGIDVGAAFCKCTALTDVIIEEGEKLFHQGGENLGPGANHFAAFYKCTNLRSVIMRGTINCNRYSSTSQSIFFGASTPNIYFSDINTLCKSNIGFGSLGERYHLYMNEDGLDKSEDVTDLERSYFVYRVEDEGKNKGKFVSYGLKDNYTTIPINIDADIVSAGILNINAFKAWRPEFQNAEFVLENGKYKCGWAVEVEHLKIPEGVTTIPDGFFAGCASLKSVTLPTSLISIGENAFPFCDNLQLVFSPIEKPFTFKADYTMNIFSYSSTTEPENFKGFYRAFWDGETTFTVYYGIKKDQLTLYVPKGSVSDYKNTNDWSKFPNILSYDPDNPPTDIYPSHHHENVTITANSYTIAYGDDLPEFEYTTTWAALSGTPEITCDATKTSPVGTYPIVVSKGSVTYTKTSFVNGTLTITKAPLTIKAGNYTKVEGEENPAFTLAYEGFRNNETSAVLTKQPTVSCSATEDSPAGSYPVTVSGAETQNYEINYVAGTLTVTAKGGGSGGDNPDAIITIADSKAMAVCVEKWDTDGDGKLSKAEAAAVTDIGDTFKGNKELTSLDMLQFFTGLTTIPKSAFSGCTSLKSIRLPKTIKSIENYAFCYCYELTSLTIPASVTSIGAYEFEYCHNLSEIIVEEGNTVYDSRNHCNAIIETKYNNLKYGCKNTVIPESVTQTGGSDVFYGNEGLTSIHIPANINYINSGLFSGCKNLSSITVAADNGRYDSRNNCNAIIETGTNDLIEGCKSTVIPNDVVSIHYYAFSERAAGKVTIPGNVKTIGDQAFNSCKELKTVVMEEGVEEIGDNTFQSCRALETIVLPSTITTIKSRAFANDNNVKFIISNISAPSEIPSDAFSACYNNATLYVPAGTKSLYMQTPGWQGFENIVEKGTIERGNANGDNAVNQTDIELVTDYIMEGKTKGLDFFNADANGDYEINAADIVEIVKIKSSY